MFQDCNFFTNFSRSVRFFFLSCLYCWNFSNSSMWQTSTSIMFFFSHSVLLYILHVVSEHFPCYFFCWKLKKKFKWAHQTISRLYWMDRRLKRLMIENGNEGKKWKIVTSIRWRPFGIEQNIKLDWKVWKLDGISTLSSNALRMCSNVKSKNKQNEWFIFLCIWENNTISLPSPSRERFSNRNSWFEIPCSRGNALCLSLHLHLHFVSALQLSRIIHFLAHLLPELLPP